MKVATFVSFLAGLLSASLVLSANSTTTAGVWCNTGETYCVSWIPMAVSGVSGVQITLSSPQAYWLGLGIGGVSMVGTKLYILYPGSNGQPVLSIQKGLDGALTPGYVASTNDGRIVNPASGSPVLCGGCNVATAFVASFWRPLAVTSDTSDVPISPSTNYAWALGGTAQVSNPDDPANIDFHPHTLMDTIQVDMSTVPNPNATATTSAPAPKATNSGPALTFSSTATFASSSKDFSITATRDPTTKLVTISVQSTLQGYIGIGLGSSLMNGANMYVGWLNGGNTILSQRNAGGHVTPTPVSGQADFKLLSALPSSVAALSGAKIQFAFTIPLGSVSTSGPTNLIYAVSDSAPSKPSDAGSSITQHTTGHYGSFSLDLTKDGTSVGSTVTTNTDLFRLVHGILMFVAWGVFPFIGVFVARFLKARLGHNWYRIHVATMILGPLVLSVTGLVLIELTISGQRFITSIHGIVGTVITFAFMPLQIALGFVANHLFDAERAKVPWWDQMHWWVGRLVMLAALVNIYLGLSAYGAGIVWVGVYVGWVVLMLIALGVGQYLLGASHHVKGNKAFEDKNFMELQDGFDRSGRPPRRGSLGGKPGDRFDSGPRRSNGDDKRGKGPSKSGGGQNGYSSPFDLNTDNSMARKSSGRGNSPGRQNPRDNRNERDNRDRVGSPGSHSSMPRGPPKNRDAVGGNQRFNDGPSKPGNVRTFTPDGRSRPGPNLGSTRTIHGSLSRDGQRPKSPARKARDW